MPTKTFHDVYHSCKNCPVEEYCGTMIQSTRLCKSYKEENINLDLNIEIVKNNCD